MMDFDTWMLTKHPDYRPQLDGAHIRAKREAWNVAQRELRKHLNGVVQRQANLSLDTLEYLDGQVNQQKERP